MDKDKDKIWVVKEIVNLRRVKGVVQYQVWQTHCVELEDTSEMFHYLDNCTKKIQEF